MQSEESDDPGLAVEPVGQSPNSNSQVCEFYAQAFYTPPKMFGPFADFSTFVIALGEVGESLP